MSEMRYTKIGEVDFEFGSRQSEMLKAMKEPHSGFLCRHKGTRLEPGEKMMDEFEVFRDRYDVQNIDKPIYTVLGKILNPVDALGLS